MALWFLINWYLYQRKQAFVFKCTQFRIKNKWLGYEGFLSLGLEEYPEFWFKIIKKKIPSNFKPKYIPTKCK